MESKYADIDEAEEDALLKSDDEMDKYVGEEENEENMLESSSSSDEEDDEDKLLQDYKLKLEEVEKNPFAYEAYAELCKLSHETGDLDKIREAYAKFANAYPLAPDIWLKYLRVEISVAQSPAEIKNVEILFRKALQDYYSFDVALEFADFSKRCENSDLIWQELLRTFGLHIMRGRELFEKYRQQLQQQHDQTYIDSYLLELKYPLKGMEDSYIDFKVFFEKNKAQLADKIEWSEVERFYGKAKQHLQKILPYEQELAGLEAHCHRERAEIYYRYIKEADKFLDENVLQTVYERMVADCCLNVDCWLTYVDFLQYRDEYARPQELAELPVFLQTAEQILQRALRNCSWSESLYVKRMFLIEQRGGSREEVQEVLESSLTVGFQTPEPLVVIWLEYLSYLRRNTDFNEEAQCEILRKNFNLAWTILGQQWGVLADTSCEILKFWGRLEYGPLLDLRRGKELWTTVMESSDNATISGLWIEFTQLEMRRDLESTRNLYKRALNSPGLDNPQVIASAWERFERCNGSVKSLKKCLNEITKFWSEYRPKTTDVKKGTKRKATEESKQTHKDTTVKRSKVSTAEQDANKSRAHNEMAAEEHAQQEIDTAKDHLRIFLSNLDYNLTEEDLQKELAELNIVRVDLIRSPNGRSRGFGYLELKSEQDVQRALEMDRRMLQGRPMYVSSVLRDKEKREKFKYSDDMEPTKLFVKSLPGDTTQEELQAIFSAYGKLKDIRLVYHKSGKFKNIAYVEFENEAAAGKALMGTNQMDLRGHLLSVAISAPPPKLNATNVPNMTKMLGMSSKRAKGGLDQKPRLALVPNSVRQKLTADSKAMPPPTAIPTTANGTAATGKSNADFRKMLLK